MKKLQTAKQIFATQGIKGISSVLLKDKLAVQWSRFNDWLKVNNWWMGRLVEIKGNYVLIDGCNFSLRSPAISTSFKSYFLYGEYELLEREAVEHFLNPKLPVIELGGAMGVIACLTNRKLLDPQKHVVIEANPEILDLLEENRKRNNCHFTILHKAIAYGVTEVSFNLCDDFWESSVQAQFVKTVTVPAMSLQEIVHKFGFEKFTLICDIEGGEVDLVKFDSKVICELVDTLIIEVHSHVVGTKKIEDMLQNLKSMGFKTVKIANAVHVMQKKQY